MKVKIRAKIIVGIKNKTDFFFILKLKLKLKLKNLNCNCELFSNNINYIVYYFYRFKFFWIKDGFPSSFHERITSYDFWSSKRLRIGHAIIEHDHISWDIDKGKVWNNSNKLLFNTQPNYEKSYQLQIIDILSEEKSISSTLKSNINDINIIFKWI